VSSYLTFSPLPSLARFGGVFSVALSVVGSTEVVDAQALPGSAPYGARTFLECLRTRDHPADNIRPKDTSASR